MTVPPDDLREKVRASEARLSQLDFAIRTIEQPLHTLWEERRQEQDTLLALRRMVADSTPQEVQS